MIKEDSYPRILIIDHCPISRTSNNGIVKSNILQDWPRDKLAQIFSSTLAPGFDVCSYCWRLKKTDILKGVIRFASSGEIFDKREIRNDSAGKYNALHRGRSKYSKITNLIFPNQFRTFLGESIFRLPSVYSTPLRAWIEGFSPEIIFSMIGTGRMLRTVVIASQLYDIPILPYFTDDWISTLYKGKYFDTLLRRSMLYWFSECLKRAPYRITISDAMSEEYTKRYGGEFTTFMNLVECKHGIIDRPLTVSSEHIVRFLFIGSLAPERWRPLRAIGEALFDLYTEGIKAELQIYTFEKDIDEYGTKLTLNPVMKIIGTASPDEVSDLQNNADILVHVESFEKEYRKYTRFSLSTKIPQYMITGNCIFAYGPGEVASIKYLTDTKTGVAVCEEDKSLLRMTIKKLITSKKLRQSTATRARKVALKRNDGSSQRVAFQKVVLHSYHKWNSLKRSIN